MNFNNLTKNWIDIFEILKEKRSVYDPRKWENLWPGFPARWILKFLGQAMTASVDSTCLNRHTGACLVDIKRQENGELVPFSISACFNGAPTGISNCVKLGYCYYKKIASDHFKKEFKINKISGEFKEEFKEFKNSFFQFCRASHAEQNAIFFSPSAVSGKILFSTTDPCPECAKMIVQNGIGAIIYAVPYKENKNGPILAEQSRLMFKEANIPCVNVKIPEDYFLWLEKNIRNAGRGIFDKKYD
jgi:deoxycytidylate deaminase